MSCLHMIYNNSLPILQPKDILAMNAGLKDIHYNAESKYNVTTANLNEFT